MSCGNPTWIVYVIETILYIAGLLCIALMQKAEHDQQINRIDAKWIRIGRRVSFISIALFAWITAITDISPLPFLLLLISTSILLTIDIISMNQRPPRSGYQFVMDKRYSPMRKLVANIFSRHHDRI